MCLLGGKDNSFFVKGTVNWAQLLASLLTLIDCSQQQGTAAALPCFELDQY